MKKIVCELCEGMEFTKVDGMFVCNECGTRYTVEEAKALMREVEGAAPSISVPASAPVVVDNTEKINNMMINAKRAYDDGKYPQAEQLYGQVLNEDPNNVMAILYEGLALGWQGNTVKFTMSQAHDAAVRALELAHEQMGDSEAFKAFYVIVLAEISNLGAALIKLCQKNRTEVANTFTRQMNDLTRRLNALPYGVDTSFLEREAHHDKAHYEEQENKFKKVQDETLFLMLNTYKKVVELISNINFYTREDFAHIQSEIKDLKECALFDSTKRRGQDIMNKISSYLRQMDEAERAEKKRIIEAYWEAHPEEKAALEAERQTLEAEKKELDEKIAVYTVKLNELKKEKAEKVSAELEQDDYKKEIRALLGDRSELGLFSFKERKEIDEKMEVLRTKISGLELLVEKQKKEKEKDIAARNSAIRQEMRPMEERKRIIITRISEIEAEFVMNR